MNDLEAARQLMGETRTGFLAMMGLDASINKNARMLKQKNGQLAIQYRRYAIAIGAAFEEWRAELLMAIPPEGLLIDEVCHLLGMSRYNLYRKDLRPSRRTTPARYYRSDFVRFIDETSGDYGQQRRGLLTLSFKKYWLSRRRSVASFCRL